MASLLLLPFEKDLLCDFVKEIVGDQKGNIFRFDSQNLKCEVERLFDVILAPWQIFDLFAFFYLFGDFIFKFLDALLDDRVPVSYSLRLVFLLLFFSVEQWSSRNFLLL